MKFKILRALERLSDNNFIYFSWLSSRYAPYGSGINLDEVEHNYVSSNVSDK